MEKKRATGLHVLVVFLLLVAVLHTVAHVFLYGTGVAGLASGGVSGFSVGDLNLAEDVEVQAQALSPISRLVIVAEWMALIGLVVFSMMRTRIHTTPALPVKEIHIELSKGPGRTDLDVLYDLLHQEKSVALSQIQKSFGVSKETVENWCKTLESGNLAEVYYPRLGEPELRLTTP